MTALLNTLKIVITGNLLWCKFKKHTSRHGVMRKIIHLGMGTGTLLHHSILSLIIFLLWFYSPHVSNVCKCTQICFFLLKPVFHSCSKNVELYVAR